MAVTPLQHGRETVTPLEPLQFQVTMRARGTQWRSANLEENGPQVHTDVEQVVGVKGTNVVSTIWADRTADACVFLWGHALPAFLER